MTALLFCSAVLCSPASSSLQVSQSSRIEAGSRKSLVDFGVPKGLAKPLGVLLPVSEVLVAIGLLLHSFAWIGAIGALALFLIFILGITVTLARGKRPDCHCFGQLHSKPIGWDLVARNAVLAALAAFVISAGPRQPSFGDWIASAISATSGGPLILVIGIAGVALLALQSWLIFQLIQQGGRVLLRLDALEKQVGGKAEPEAPGIAGLPVGEAAPSFELEDLQGRSVSLDQLRSGDKPVMLLFAHPGCGPCGALLPEAAQWQRDGADHFRLVVVSQGTRDENTAKMRPHGIDTVLLQREHEVADQYDALSTPSAVLVRAQGAIGSAVATGAEAIRSLVANTINESTLSQVLAGPVSSQLEEGANAPALVFPDLEGRMFRLSETRGTPTIVLFWNPGCGFCQQMTDDLKRWEKKASKAGTQVVFISTGSTADNEKQGFRSRILLDQHFSAGKVFGVTGTPSALLLDEEGKLASRVSGGTPGNLGLRIRRSSDARAQGVVIVLLDLQRRPAAGDKKRLKRSAALSFDEFRDCVSMVCSAGSNGW